MHHPTPAQQGTTAAAAPLNPKQRHPESAGTRLCVDCTHYKDLGEPGGRTAPCCGHPTLGFSVVTGLPKVTTCATARDRGDLCGLEGHWFSPSAGAQQCPSERT